MFSWFVFGFSFFTACCFHFYLVFLFVTSFFAFAYSCFVIVLVTTWLLLLLFRFSAARFCHIHALNCLLPAACRLLLFQSALFVEIAFRLFALHTTRVSGWFAELCHCYCCHLLAVIEISFGVHVHSFISDCCFFISLFSNFVWQQQPATRWHA